MNRLEKTIQARNACFSDKAENEKNKAESEKRLDKEVGRGIGT